MPTLDGRQRYAKLTWTDILPINADVFCDDPLAAKLTEFLDTVVIPAPAMKPALEPNDRIDAAVFHAMRIAPALNGKVGDTKADRGKDVAFIDVEEARVAERAIRAALADAGLEKVTTWLWRPQSSGTPQTDSGAEVGFELRLAPSR